MKNETSFSLVNLDDVDRHIINLLQTKIRRTNADIARAIDMTETTVKNRIDRLLAQNVLDIFAVLNPKALGYNVVIQIIIRTVPGRIEKVGKMLRELKGVVDITYLTGPFDIAIEVVVQNSNHAYDFISRELGKITGIQSFESCFVLHTARMYHEWRLQGGLSNSNIGDSDVIGLTKIQRSDKKLIDKNRHEKPAFAVNLDDTDKQIIRLLQAQARRANADIARLIKKSETTVKSRLNRLIEREVLEIVTILNPHTLGYGTQIHIAMTVQPDQIEIAGEALLSLEMVNYLAYVTGRFNIVFGLLMQDSNQFFECMNKALKGISGILLIESYYSLRKEISNYEWKLPYI